MTRVLITGAGGFIGGALIRACPEHVQVVAMSGPDDIRSDYSASVVERCIGDIVDQALLQELSNGCKTIVHLAGPASVAESFANPLETLRSHVLGAGALVTAAQKAGVHRLIHVSSAEVYGRASSIPVSEEVTPAPRSPYAAAKLAAESVFAAAARASDLDVLIIRPFSVYGPGQRSNGLMGSLISQALSENPVKLFDLSPCRDYVHVDDVCRALWLAEQLDPWPRTALTVNVASGLGVSVDQLARCVLQLVNREGESAIEQGSDRIQAAAIPSLVGCTKRSEQVLGWRCEIDLLKGLQDTLAYYKHRTG